MMFLSHFYCEPRQVATLGLIYLNNFFHHFTCHFTISIHSSGAKVPVFLFNSLNFIIKLSCPFPWLPPNFVLQPCHVNFITYLFAHISIF